MDPNPNDKHHPLLLQIAKSIDIIPTRNTDFHGDGTATGTPRSNPSSPASGHSTGPTSLPPTDDSTDDPTADPTADPRNLYYADQKGSCLLCLPSELRCIIWRDLLVTTKVYVSFTNCLLLVAQRGAKRKRRATKRVSGFNEGHVEYYGVLGDDDNGEEADVGTYFSPRRCHDDWFEYAMRSLSIQLPAKFRDSYHPRPHLSILGACRLIREEAESIFYKENCFVFCTCNQLHDYNAAREISAAHAAYCFFQDRSPDALKEIKDIELHVMH